LSVWGGRGGAETVNTVLFARGITVAGTPQQSAVIEQAQELVRFARQHGYRVDELIEITKATG
jgi:hypothetical protein